MSIGQKIRLLRRTQKRTLQDIADICGFTRGLLSKIETGRTTPPVATLTKIATSLGVKVAVLLDDDAHTSTAVFVPRDSIDPAKATRTSTGYGFIPIAASRSNKAMQPYLFTARRVDVRPQQRLSHEGEEFIFVLDGAMSMRVGAIEYAMVSGDSLYFDSIEEHQLTPLSDSVTYLAIFTQPNGGK